MAKTIKKMTVDIDYLLRSFNAKDVCVPKTKTKEGCTALLLDEELREYVDFTPDGTIIIKEGDIDWITFLYLDLFMSKHNTSYGNIIMYASYLYSKEELCLFESNTLQEFRTIFWKLREGGKVKNKHEMICDILIRYTKARDVLVELDLIGLGEDGTLTVLKLILLLAYGVFADTLQTKIDSVLRYGGEKRLHKLYQYFGMKKPPADFEAFLTYKNVAMVRYGFCHCLDILTVYILKIVLVSSNGLTTSLDVMLLEQTTRLMNSKDNLYDVHQNISSFSIEGTEIVDLFSLRRRFSNKIVCVECDDAVLYFKENLINDVLSLEVLATVDGALSHAVINLSLTENKAVGCDCPLFVIITTMDWELITEKRKSNFATGYEQDLISSVVSNYCNYLGESCEPAKLPISDIDGDSKVAYTKMENGEYVKSTVVMPFKRFLGDGFVASPERHELARKYCMRLKLGETLVDRHVRGYTGVRKERKLQSKVEEYITSKFMVTNESEIDCYKYIDVGGQDELFRLLLESDFDILFRSDGKEEVKRKPPMMSLF